MTSPAKFFITKNWRKVQKLINLDWYKDKKYKAQKFKKSESKKSYRKLRRKTLR
jgi:hypothetical protein